jgi:hypothetical protein
MRALVYDRTCISRLGGMSRIWATGASMYRKLRRVDEVIGVDNWDDALAWVASRPEPIQELQYWGHGKWGGAYVADDFLGADALEDGHPRRPAMDAVRARLAPDALVWFRTCETFGARRGIEFAERLAGFLGARVAGHTFVIHHYQSGLHGLAPGGRADWSPEEGLAEGTPDEPIRARTSMPWATRTITALVGRVPEAWFAR